MAQGGEARDIRELAEVVTTEIQTQQQTQMTQAADLGYAIILPDNQQTRHGHKKSLCNGFVIIGSSIMNYRLTVL